ncbi:MAG: hypothetical protein AAGB31_06635 [Bdellovibrio sp.]
MKKMILAMMLIGSSAMANTTLFKCVVPESKSVSLNIELADDQSVDFVIVNLKEGNGQSVFFSQLDKGSVSEQLKQGSLSFLALTEQSAQVDGVIVNTGLLSLEVAGNAAEGLLLAKGNIYPLSCTK